MYSQGREGSDRPGVRPVGDAETGAPRLETPHAGVHREFSFEQEDSRLALDLLRGMADQELARAERFSSQARNGFALAAGFFAVVQTVAFGSFLGAKVTTHELWAIMGLAAAASALLAMAGFFVLEVQRTRRGYNLSPEIVIGVLGERGGEEGAVVDRFVELYAGFVDSLRGLNTLRRDAAGRVRMAVTGSLCLTVLELLVAFWVRR